MKYKVIPFILVALSIVSLAATNIVYKEYVRVTLERNKLDSQLTKLYRDTYKIVPATGGTKIYRLVPKYDTVQVLIP